jgi:uncharacterized protein (DUF1015 family)
MAKFFLMTKIIPFAAWRYNKDKINDLATVLTQPYDKITPQMQGRYYSLSPHNLVRIILGRQNPGDAEGENVYTRAEAAFRAWVKAGIFIRDAKPAIYAYFQKYQVPGGGATKLRKGFIGLGKLEDYDKRVIFPHERTLSGPKQDRLRLLDATQAHFESIFMLYRDEARAIDDLLDEHTTCSPEVSVIDEYGVEHSLWAISDGAAITRIQQRLADRPLIIADGHHRYETALAYRNQRRSQAGACDESAAYEYMLMTFFNTESEGLTILPTHRLISRLDTFELRKLLRFAEGHFEISRLGLRGVEDVPALKQRLEAEGRSGITFGVCAAEDDGFYLLSFKNAEESLKLFADLSPRQQKLDVSVLHRILIEHGLGIDPKAVESQKHIEYVREFEAGIEAVRQARAQLCFFLNPTRIDQMCEVALAGEVMPQKSTDFYPKLLSGLVVYSLAR